MKSKLPSSQQLLDHLKTHPKESPNDQMPAVETKRGISAGRRCCRCVPARPAAAALAAITALCAAAHTAALAHAIATFPDSSASSGPSLSLWPSWAIWISLFERSIAALVASAGAFVAATNTRRPILAITDFLPIITYSSLARFIIAVFYIALNRPTLVLICYQWVAFNPEIAPQQPDCKTAASISAAFIISLLLVESLLHAWTFRVFRILREDTLDAFPPQTLSPSTRKYPDPPSYQNIHSSPDPPSFTDPHPFPHHHNSHPFAYPNHLFAPQPIRSLNNHGYHVIDSSAVEPTQLQQPLH